MAESILDKQMEDKCMRCNQSINKLNLAHLIPAKYINKYEARFLYYGFIFCDEHINLSRANDASTISFNYYSFNKIDILAKLKKIAMLT
jgi:hypothetical protein